jgi:hypothetical protein
MTSRGWRGLGWLSPVEAVGGDLSRPGFLRCRGGGPREVAEDEGLPVLLGDRSVRTKGSTGRVAVWHTEAEEEKGRGGGSAHRKKKGGGGVRCEWGPGGE